MCNHSNASQFGTNNKLFYIIKSVNLLFEERNSPSCSCINEVVNVRTYCYLSYLDFNQIHKTLIRIS